TSVVRYSGCQLHAAELTSVGARVDVQLVVDALDVRADRVDRRSSSEGRSTKAVGDGEGGRRRCPSRNLANSGHAKRVLAIPDLEHVRTVVLNRLTSVSGQRTYDHAIRAFVTGYCSEPRLAFNRAVVLRFRIHLERPELLSHMFRHSRRIVP